MRLSPISFVVVCVAVASGAMENPVSRLFSARYLPQRFCYLAEPALVWTNAVTDGLIAASYASLFLALLWLARRAHRWEHVRAYLWIPVSFSLFLLACGATHAMEAVTVWWPVYPFSAAVKVLCVMASVPTAILFVWVAPALAKKIPEIVNALSKTERERDEARAALLAAAAVREANERLNHILDSTSEGILKVGWDWTILYGNRQAMATLPDLAIGKDVWQSFPGLAGSEPELLIRRTMTERVPTEWENFYAPYQEWFSTHCFPSEGGISLFFNIVTERKLLERQLEDERALREQRIVALGNMAGGLAHEIGNPLAIIHATASDLGRLAAAEPPEPGAVSTEALKASELIVSTADRAIRILRGLRGFARDASHDPMEPAWVAEMVDGAIQLQESRFRRNGIDLRCSVEPEIPPVLCRATQIGQILTNLLNNAFDAVLEDDVDARWVSVEAALVDNRILIDVTDSGHGVSDEARERLMEPFFTTKTGGHGMGIGLSLSRAIAHEHGGSLELLPGSVPTRFRLLLPTGTPAGVALSGSQPHAKAPESEAR